MAKLSKGACVARQVELIIRRLNSLSTLPEIAAGFLLCLGDGKFDRSALSEIVESDPALTAKIYSLACELGVQIEGGEEISQVLLRLPVAEVQDAVLSVKVFAGFNMDRGRIAGRKQLWVHSLAVACCARRLGEIVLGTDCGALAFSAGLLHDIGKLALDEVMPKSFGRMVEQARAQRACLCEVERGHLELDHTIAGKHLAEKWGFPEKIVFAVWLHHTDTQVMSVHMPAARLAGIVRLADIIARKCDIGMSGSFDSVDSVSEIIEGMPVTEEQLDVVRSELAREVYERCELLGLEAAGGQAVYSELVHKTAARLARENTELSARRDEFELGNAQMGFVSEFLSCVSSNKSSIELAADFTLCWRKHYQTGPVCVYFWKSDEGELMDVATVDGSGCVNTAVVSGPAGRNMIAVEMEGDFAILDAGGSADWIFEQLDFDIDLSRSKIAPLVVGGKAVGAIVFEQRLPIDIVRQKSIVYVSTLLGASAIALVAGREKQSRLSEQFAELLGEFRRMRREVNWVQSLRSVSEMAAGAAHELNNPLAVVSGRTQLLYDSEADENKKQIFKQIHDRAVEMSEIVSDLMSFAKPAEPVRKAADVGELIRTVIEQTRREKKAGRLEIEVDRLDELGQACVDPEQIESAVRNVVVNALESYKETGGMVKISGDCVQPQGRVVFEIIDEGCGMDSETLEKVFEPFFSAKEAGRCRGMGLAHAKRLLEANGGSIHIKSQAGKGTVVTISLVRS